MDRSRFYDVLKDLGEFRCENDLRKFKSQRKKNPHYSLSVFLGHFGHCKNGAYHHCEFHLKPEPVHQVIYYYKVIEVDGIKIRQKGGRPMNFSGRGRPPRKK